MSAVNLADPSIHHYCIIIAKHIHGDSLFHLYQKDGEDIVRIGGRHRIYVDKKVFGSNDEKIVFEGQWNVQDRKFTRKDATEFCRNTKFSNGKNDLEKNKVEWEVIWMDLQGGDERILGYLQTSSAMHMKSFDPEKPEELEEAYKNGEIPEEVYNEIKSNIEKNKG